MECALWSESMLKEFSAWKIMGENNKDEIYAAVMSFRTEIRCVHADDLSIAHFLRTNNPALCPPFQTYKSRKTFALYFLVPFSLTSAAVTGIVISEFQG